MKYNMWTSNFKKENKPKMKNLRTGKHYDCVWKLPNINSSPIQK